MIRLRALSTILLVAASLAACEDVDPRCKSVCRIKEPALADTYSICDDQSADLCQKDCTARVRDLSSLCSDCTLEGAIFDADRASEVPKESCNNNSCVLSQDGRDCAYAKNDYAAKNSCLRMLYPRKSVQCTAKYRPVAECIGICSGQASTYPPPMSLPDLAFPLPIDLGGLDARPD